MASVEDGRGSVAENIKKLDKDYSTLTQVENSVMD